MTKGERLEAAKLFYCSPSDNPPKLSPGWNKVALLTFVRNSPCSCPFSVSLHPPQAALNSEPRKRWRLIVRFRSLHIKPALKWDSSRARPVGDAARGESGGIGSIASSSEARRPYSNQRCGCECNEQTEGLHRGCSCLRQPLSQTFGLPVPHKGEPFGVVLCAKIYELTLWLEQGRLTHCRS